MLATFGYVCLLTVSATAMNPTHYGPPSEDGGSCQEDEYDWCGSGNPKGNCFCTPTIDGSNCNSDSDCPQDTPATTEASPYCRDWGSGSKSCMLKCNSDDDCAMGSICDTDNTCVYTQSYIENCGHNQCDPDVCAINIEGTDYDFKSYDFTRLMNHEFIQEGTMLGSDATCTYRVNLCGTSNLNCGTDSSPRYGSVTQTYDDDTCTHLLGIFEGDATCQWELNDWNNSKQMCTSKLLYMENGDPCGTNGKNRQVSIAFVCPSDDTMLIPESITADETSTCVYNFTIETCAACPGK